MRAESFSHVGAVRKNNEDAIFCDVAAGLFAVADGIGGRQGGEIASATAVKIIEQKKTAFATGNPGELLREAFYEANDVLHQGGKSPELAGMGTTMTAAYIGGDHIYLVHVGDSRAYLFNRRQINQLTIDHTLVEALLQDGSISPEEAVRHPQRHVI
ncbi:MAG: protein phosphatase 2C domain-containing protein, partial [Clostridiales bacterium]